VDFVVKISPAKNAKISPHQLHIALKSKINIRIFQHEKNDFLAARFKLN
jgi:hypothetical protein